MVDYNFFENVEEKLNYVVYSDTDSEYINIPKIKPKSTNDAIKITDLISNDINKEIKKYLDNILFPKMNIPKDQNETKFKTELTADSMLLFGIKKFYAYRETSKNQKSNKVPKVKYKGIPVVRNDSSKLSQNLLAEIIEIGLLGKYESIFEQKEMCYEILMKYKNMILNDVKNLEFSYIGKPVNWKISVYKSEPSQVYGMKLYNSLIGKEQFKPGSSGFSVNIKLKNPLKIENDVFNKLPDLIFREDHNYLPINTDFQTLLLKLNYLVFPYNFDKELLSKILNEFEIEIDVDKIWNVSFNKIIKRSLGLLNTNAE